MESLVYIDHTSPVPGNSFWVNGDLKFKQRWPLQVKGGFVRPYSGTDLFDSNAVTQLEDVTFHTILNKYCDRNYTTDFVNQYTSWDSTTMRNEKVEPTTFKLSSTINVPTEEILYTPEILEVMKYAWIQYFSLLVIVAFLIDKLSVFVYHYQIISTSTKVETPGSLGGVKYHGL